MSTWRRTMLLAGVTACAAASGCSQGACPGETEATLRLMEPRDDLDLTVQDVVFPSELTGDVFPVWITATDVELQIDIPRGTSRGSEHDLSAAQAEPPYYKVDLFDRNAGHTSCTTPSVDGEPRARGVIEVRDYSFDRDARFPHFDCFDGRIEVRFDRCEQTIAGTPAAELTFVGTL